MTAEVQYNPTFCHYYSLLPLSPHITVASNYENNILHIYITLPFPLFTNYK